MAIHYRISCYYGLLAAVGSAFGRLVPTVPAFTILSSTPRYDPSSVSLYLSVSSFLSHDSSFPRTTTAASSGAAAISTFLGMKPVIRSQRRRLPPEDAGDNDETSDPWAGYRVNTNDDDDVDDKDKKDPVDDVSWLSKLGLPQQVIDNVPPIDSRPSASAATQQLPRDDFFQPFDEVQFQKMQLEYKRSTGQMTDTAITSDNKDDAMAARTAEYLETATYPKPKSSSFTTLAEHNQYQTDYYNNQTVEVGKRTYVKSHVPLIKHMAKRFITQLKKSIYEGIDQRNGWNIPNKDSESYPTTLSILDVGCGMAEYWTFLLEAANEQRVTLDITGIDLSDAAVRYVNTIQAEIALDEQGGRHVLRAQHQDVLDESMVASAAGGGGSDKYHAILLHNTWCHLWNTTLFLQRVAVEKLIPDGVLFVADTEYGGNDGSRRNNQEDPAMFPNVLPSIVDMRQVLRTLPLMILDANERIDLITNQGSGSNKVNKNSTIVTFDWYSVSLVRTVQRALPEIARFRGAVINGFGRGSKKLGFPTANLGPHSDFQSALEQLTTMTTTFTLPPNLNASAAPHGGVYFGWAVLEDATGRKKGRNTYHRAVVNIGFSPTFVGMENVQRTIEAHLILDDNDGKESINSDLTRMVPSDFYNETMRLQLHGYLRPEQKFDSLASLISQISMDVEHTKNALRLQPFAALRSDVFLVDPCRRVNNTLTSGEGQAWIGRGGGNAIASWEFEAITTALQATPLAQWVV